MKYARTTVARFAGLMVAALGLAGPAAAQTPVGRWDAKGNYTPLESTTRFKKLHKLKGDPIPRYPIVLVHGLFGFDKLKLGPLFMEYVVGVAKHLRQQGMEVFVPETKPFASFEFRARQLKAQIETTGWKKFHIIAHSAGGLDSRYMISKLGMADRVASLTTVSSPHRGVWYADWCLKWVMEKQKGWKIWDFFGLERQGIYDIGVKSMNQDFNPTTPDAPGVRYFSFGGAQPFWLAVPPLNGALLVNSVCEKAASGAKLSLKERAAAKAMLPAEVYRRLQTDPAGVVRELLGDEGPEGRAALEAVRDWIDPAKAGKNDGLVSLSSARWGEYQTDLKYDHLDEMGWLTVFQHKKFYRNITRMLADAGL